MASSVNQINCICGSIPVTVNVRSCSANPVVIPTFGLPLPGALVQVWTTATRTALVGSATSNASGVAAIGVPAAGTYYLEITHGSGRFTNYGPTAFAAGTSGASLARALGAAAGYVCAIPYCVYPIKSTLAVTNNLLGNITCTSSGSLLWNGSGSYTFPAPACGGPLTVPFLAQFNMQSFALTWNFKQTGAPLAPCAGATVWCPCGASTIFGSLGLPITYTCPPTFFASASGALVPSNTISNGGDGDQAFGRIFGSGVSLTWSASE